MIFKQSNGYKLSIERGYVSTVVEREGGTSVHVGGGVYFITSHTFDEIIAWKNSAPEEKPEEKIDEV